MKAVKLAVLTTQLKAEKEPFKVTSYGKVVATVYPSGTEVLQTGMSCGHEAIIAEQAARIEALTASRAGFANTICTVVTAYLNGHGLIRSGSRLTYEDGKIIMSHDRNLSDVPFGHPTAVPKPTKEKKERKW